MTCDFIGKLLHLAFVGSGGYVREPKILESKLTTSDTSVVQVFVANG